MTDEIFDELDRETFDAAVDAWGIDAQVDMAVEELAELIVALQHGARGKCDVEDVVDELADVRIMYEQLAEYFGRDDVEQRVVSKMDRLRERLPDEYTPEPEPLIDERTLHAARWIRHDDPLDPFELELPPYKSAAQIADEIDAILEDPYGELDVEPPAPTEWYDRLVDAVAPDQPTVAGVPLVFSGSADPRDDVADALRYATVTVDADDVDDETLERIRCGRVKDFSIGFDDGLERHDDG